MLAEQVLNTSKDEVKRMGKRPRVAYRNSLVDVAHRFDPKEAKNVMAAIGEYKRSKTSGQL